MSVESARAFCVRLMSDDEFRDAMGSAKSAEEIAAKVKEGEYDFSRADLLKIVGEMAGRKLEMSDLTKMVCDVYNEEIAADGKGSTEAVAAWLESLA